MKMAKHAKINLMGIHNVEITKKVFELNHDGRCRLTEIGETVSRNCSVAKGSDQGRSKLYNGGGGEVILIDSCSAQLIRVLHNGQVA